MSTIKTLVMGSINIDILNNFDHYVEFLSNEKFVDKDVILVKEKKPNNRKELCFQSPIMSDYPFGNTELLIEAPKCLSGKFSAKILTDKIANRMLLRYDSDGGAHRNKFDDIPLSEQSVTTPHLHKYDEQGRFLAIKTSSIMKDEKKARDIETGFHIFCEEGRLLSSVTSDYPQAFIGEMGRGLFEEETDPCEGVNFD